MGTRFKAQWDSTKNMAQDMVGTESAKMMIIKLDEKSDEAKIFVGGIVYCLVNGDNHWILGCNSETLTSHARVPNGSMKDGKYVSDANVEKAFREAYEKYDYTYALCVDGHKGAEALVKALDKTYADADFFVITEDADKVTAVVEAIKKGEEPDISGVFSAKFLILEESEATNSKDRKGNKIPCPNVSELIPHLPKVKASGGKGSYGSGKPGYMPTAERLKDVLALKDNADFETLYQWFKEDSLRVSFALALTGVTISPKPTLDGLPTEKPAKEVKKDVTEKKPDTANASDTTILLNFAEVAKKEVIDDEDAMETFSKDALDAIASPDTVDSYKRMLFKLSEFKVNGKAFPFGITKKKLGITGSVFTLSFDELDDLRAKAEI